MSNEGIKKHALPRHVKTVVTKTNSPTIWLINRSPSLKASNSPPIVTDVKALVVNADQGGNPKGGKIFGKGKIRAEGLLTLLSLCIPSKPFLYNFYQVLGILMRIELQLMFISSWGNRLKNTINNSCGSKRITIENDFPNSWGNRLKNTINNSCGSKRITIENDFPKSRVDPTILNDFEMATDGNGDPPVLDLRTMKELCQLSLNGREFLQFHGLPGDDANKHPDKFLHVTQSIKVNGVTDDALRLYLFPHSLTLHATAWFDRLPRNSINTFEQVEKIFIGKYFSPSMVMKLRNEITNYRQRPDDSLFEAWEHYKLSIDRCPNHNMLPVTQIDTFYNGLTLRHRDIINATIGVTFMKRRPLEAVLLTVLAQKAHLLI
nr:reverse transcriptase domain-containing protein [Tanacetum cinerariifolium]